MAPCAHPRSQYPRRLLELLVCVLVLSAGPALATDVQSVLWGRTDLRVRSPLGGDRAKFITTDIELLPNAQVTLGWDRTHLLLQYNPSILFREPQLLGPVLLLHRGRVVFTQAWARARLSLYQDAAAGIADVGTLLPADGSTPITGSSGTGTLGALPYERFASIGSFDANPTDHFSFYLSGGYMISGSPVFNVTLPLQWGPLANARFRGEVWRHNALITSAQYFQATFATSQSQLIGSVTESFERQLSREFTASLGGGVAYTKEHLVAYMNGPIAGNYEEILPVVVGTAVWRSKIRDAPASFNVNARLGPFADRYTALVYERIETQLTSEWRFRRQWTSVGNAGFAYAVPIGKSQQVGDSIYYAETGARWGIFNWLMLGVLGRVVWSEQPRTGGPGQLQYLVTFSATVHDERSVAW